ncbi:hypothetical protein DH2020_049837 [Rehmannia glutinosa]|uniref:Uncharacterized protein n=1 Tax=Rehmannia glutinosa TaxID=99300 RepID=A0ABR0U1M3_REHGL
MASGNNKYTNFTTKQNETGKDRRSNRAVDRGRPRNLGVVPRRRTWKKDRHSKICTAQGIRDRRMRLSLQVARKFFDLQDMLGFDKASKTIEWLFVQSKKAIKELTDTDAKSESFVSECDEVVSGLIEENSNNIDVKESVIPNETTPFCDERENMKKSVGKPIRESARDRARARARWRTREKMMIKCLGDYYPGPNSDDSQKLLGFSNNFQEGVDQDSNLNNQERVVSLYSSIFEQQFGDVGTIEKLLGNSSSSNSCPNISDYHRSGGVSGLRYRGSVMLNFNTFNSETTFDIYGFLLIEMTMQ